ncbi:hypothetical protein GCM10023238_27010 [Streptomyces heliomycini]
MTAAADDGAPARPEERKAADRLDIARAAVDRVSRQGVTRPRECRSQRRSASRTHGVAYFPPRELRTTALSSASTRSPPRMRQWRPGEPLQEALAPGMSAGAVLPGRTWAPCCG